MGDDRITLKPLQSGEGEEDSMSDHQEASVILDRTSRLLQRSHSSLCQI